MKRQSVRPQVERLESREVPAVLNWPSTVLEATLISPPPLPTPSSAVTLSSGVLKIQGTNSTDVVNIFRTAANQLVVQTGGALGFHMNFYNPAQVSKIVFRGGAQQDFFTGDPTSTIPIVAYGDEGDDVLVGGGGNDQLYGGIGDDILRGEGGNDSLMGEAGNDHLFGSNGNDRLFGGNGYDELFGGDGDDRLDGGYDYFVDRLEGGVGADAFIVHQKAKFIGWKTFAENIVDLNYSQNDQIKHDHHLLGP